MTLFEQGSQATNVTYLFANSTLANSALSSGNYNSAEGWISFATGQQTGTRSGVNFTVSGNTGSTDWLGTSDHLSGVANIEWYIGLSSLFNVNNDSPNSFLGNNSASQSEASTDGEDLSDDVVDPLVLNLDGKAVTTTALGTNGVKFDTLGTGTAQATGWITAGEGILVYDPTGGAITSGSQFITSLNQLAQYADNGQSGSAQSLSASQLQSLSAGSASQYESSLSQLASVANNGGVTEITAAEASDLRVWVPGTNGKGGQLYTLAQLGISGIDLESTVVGKVNNGNEINSSFNFVYANGFVGQGADVTLEVAPNLPSSVNTQVNTLISAMASLAPSSSAQLQVSQYPQVTTPVIAASLH